MQALSQDHCLLIPVSDDEEVELELTTRSGRNRGEFHGSPCVLPNRSDILEFLESLPKNLQWEKGHRRETTPCHERVARELDILEEEGSDLDDDQVAHAEAGLKIAWQYRKSVQQQRLGQAHSTTNSTRTHASTFCHSYDLGGTLVAQRRQALSSARFEPFSSHLSGLQLFRLLWGRIQSLGSLTEPRVLRILLYHMDPKLLASVLPLLLAKIRQEDLPIVVLVVDPLSPFAENSTSKLVRRSCDVILETDHFSTRTVFPPPPEFRDFQGILKIVRVSTVTAATANGAGHFCDMTSSKRPAAFVYGLKRDRRKLHINLLHIPPEDYAPDGGSVGSRAVRSGAGRTDSGLPCAASGGSSPIDF